MRFCLRGVETTWFTGAILIADATFFRTAQFSCVWFNVVGVADDPEIVSPKVNADCNVHH